MAAIDMTPFISQIVTGGVVLAVVSIAASLAVVLVARSGAGQVLRMLFDKYENHEKERRFQERYRREQRNREYRSWKSKRGYR